MSKKAFTGLILLIVALLVASVPALLTPASQGVEQAAVKVGILQPAKAPEPAEFPRRGKTKSGKKEKAADSRLELRGYEVEEDGDLRDTVDPLDREAFGRGRLTHGSSRVMLPGQRDRSSEAPPATSEDGVLLDISGCPVFREGTDVVALLAVPETQNLYAQKVEDSDDPAFCNQLLQQRIDDATTPVTTTPLGATTARDRAAIRRGGQPAMVIAFKEIELLSQFMDDASLQEALAALQGEGATASTDTAAAGASAGATAGASSATSKG